MRGCYPVIIRYDESDKVFYVDVPDFGTDGENFTYGEDIPDALYMAWDAVNLLLCDYCAEHNGDLPPLPSKPGERVAKDGEILSWVWYDTEQYKKIVRLLKEQSA